MTFKYKVGIHDELFEVEEIEGIIFAENFKAAIATLLDYYSDPGLDSLHVDFLDEIPMFEF